MAEKKNYGRGSEQTNPFYPGESEFKSSHGKGNIESNHGSAYGVPCHSTNAMDERLKNAYRGGSKGGKK